MNIYKILYVSVEKINVLKSFIKLLEKFIKNIMYTYKYIKFTLEKMVLLKTILKQLSKLNKYFTCFINNQLFPLNVFSK